MKYKIHMTINLKVCAPVLERSVGNAYISLKQYDLAYCYFMKFLSSCNRNSSAFSSVEKIAAYAQSKRDSNYNAQQHFQKAMEHENNLEYREALDEYENYKYLSSDNEERGKRGEHCEYR